MSELLRNSQEEQPQKFTIRVKATEMMQAQLRTRQREPLQLPRAQTPPPPPLPPSPMPPLLAGWLAGWRPPAAPAPQRHQLCTCCRK